MASSFMRWQIIGYAGAVMLAGALLNGGCDDKPHHSDAPPPASESKPKPIAGKPAGPTTQELLHAPRHRVQLTPIPASVMVPPGWGVHQMPGSSVVFLQGLMPNGEEVHIQLSRKETRWTDTTAKNISMNERIALLKAGALKEQQDHSQQVKRVSVRDLGSAKIFEKQSISPPSTMLHLDDKGEPIKLPPFYRWTITLFIPTGEGFNAYELNFLDLNTVEYEASHDFLNGIMDTLELDAAGPATKP